MDERTLREVYLAAFEPAVRRARPWTVMAAYNRLGGVYCCEHEWLLRQVLRDEWGFGRTLTLALTRTLTRTLILTLPLTRCSATSGASAEP